jgi:hypothetical protein
MRFGRILLVLLFWPSPAKGDKPWSFESEGRFGASTWPNAYADTTGLWTLGVEAGSGRQATETNATVWFKVSGSGAIQGNSTYQIVIGGMTHAHWGVIIRRTGKGPIQVRTFARIEGRNPSSYDLSQYLLDVEFRPWAYGIDTVITRENRFVQRIQVRDGKRYRCGGERFVAIDDEEQESPRDYQRRAAVLSQRDLHCADCKLTGPVEVPVVVTVGRKGAITWARPDAWMQSSEPVPQTTVNPHLWATIERGLKKFRYQTAVADGHPVADYALFKVRVVP